jgi:hypothetical protein
MMGIQRATHSGDMRLATGQMKPEWMNGVESDALVVEHAWLRVPLWIVATAILSCWIALAVLHVGDDYRVGHGGGTWAALAETARAGRLYPPIFDGEHYAGTRYMPLPILLNALASGAVGDPLIGGKVLAGLLTITLMALVIFVLRRVLCPWPIATALAGVVIATDTGLQASSTIGGDLLPAVLQVCALAAVIGGRGRSVMLIAGAFAGLAIASKLTGVWAFLAITTWLVMHRRWQHAVTFSGACAGVAALVLGSVELLTGGGLSEHLLAFSLAGVGGGNSFLRGPNQLLFNLLGHASGIVVLFPLAVLGALLSRGWRQLPVIHVALVYSILLLLVVYSDIGTGFNQLLDLVVLTALAAGHLAAPAASSERQVHAVLIVVVSVVVIWAAGLDLVRTLGFDLRSTVAALKAGTVPRRTVDLVAGMVRPGEQVLAEDPSIEIALGRQPVVMDAFMLARLERAHPEKVDPLISWIDSRRFDLVVLVVSLEDPTVEFWWNDFQYGPRVAAALRKSYRPDGLVGRYFVYRPRQ